MQNSAVCLLVSLVVMQGVFVGCSRTESDISVYGEFVDEQAVSGLDYAVDLPPGWNEVRKQEDVNKLVFWGLVNYNHTSRAEKPLFRAWCGPEESHSFLTIMEVKRHRNLGLGVFYDDIIRFLREQGWQIQETGVTEIDNMRCKWWVQAVPNGALHQQCFLVTHGPYVYALAFTTSYMTDEKQKLFMQIAKSVTFRKGA